MKIEFGHTLDRGDKMVFMLPMVTVAWDKYDVTIGFGWMIGIIFISFSRNYKPFKR